LEYVGNVKAQEEVNVYPKVTGKIIEKVKDEGDAVNKGDVIAYIDRDEVGLKFEKAPVESPINGIVGRVLVDIGSSVTSQTPVALVVDMNKVKISLDIPELYISRVSLGLRAQVKVDSYPQEEFLGQVTKISPVLDLQVRSAPIEIEIENSDHRLKSGMFARVILNLSEHKGVPVVMKEALLGKNHDTFVYIVENRKAVRRPVMLGIRQDSSFEVVEGLKEDDLVVIMGQQRLTDGTLVSIEEEYK